MIFHLIWSDRWFQVFENCWDWFFNHQPEVVWQPDELAEHSFEFRHSGICFCIVGEASHPRYVEASKTVGIHRKPFLTAAEADFGVFWIVLVSEKIKQKSEVIIKLGIDFWPSRCPLFGSTAERESAVPRTDSMLKGRPIFVREQLRSYRFHQPGESVNGKVSQHVFMPWNSVAIQNWLAENSTNFFMVKSERDIRKFTSSYSFNWLVVLMKNNSDFPTFSNQSRCTKKIKKGEDREERGGSGQAVPPCFMFHLGLNMGH